MSRGLRSSQIISTMRDADRRARSNIFGLFASTGALPGRLMPSASHTMCIELAVPLPAQTPGPPTALSHIARRRRADLERQSAGLAHRVLDDFRDAVEVAEADRQLGRAVDDGNLRFLKILVGQTERLPLCAAHRLARGARLEITSERLSHS